MSTFYDYIGLALDAAVTIYLIQLHRKDCRTINNIKQAPSLDIGQDLSSLLDTSPNQTLPYAAIRGQVTDMNGTVSSSTGGTGVMQIITIHEIKTFDNSWNTSGIPPLNETRNSVPFGLKPLLNLEGGEISSAPIVVEVKDPFDSIWENLLLPCSSCFIPKNTSINSAVMGNLGNAKSFGIRKTEKFLPLGTIITGIGQIVKDSETGQFQLQEPLEGGSSNPYILTTLSIDDLIGKLELKKKMQRIIIATTMSIALVILSKRAYSWWRYYKLEKLRKSILKERRRNKNLDNLCPCQTCLVCLVNPREVILHNCGHVAICSDCVLKVNGLCPICREPISETRKAFIA